MTFGIDKYCKGWTGCSVLTLTETFFLEKNSIPRAKMVKRNDKTNLSSKGWTKRTHTHHTHTHTTYSLTDTPIHIHFPLCLTHQYISPTINLVDKRSLLIRSCWWVVSVDKVLLINTLVLPYLVDKTMSQSTRIPNIEIIIDETVDTSEEEPEI